MNTNDRGSAMEQYLISNAPSSGDESASFGVIPAFNSSDDSVDALRDEGSSSDDISDASPEDDFVLVPYPCAEVRTGVAPHCDFHATSTVPLDNSTRAGAPSSSTISYNAIANSSDDPKDRSACLSPPQDDPDEDNWHEVRQPLPTDTDTSHHQSEDDHASEKRQQTAFEHGVLSPWDNGIASYRESRTEGFTLYPKHNWQPPDLCGSQAKWPSLSTRYQPSEYDTFEKRRSIAFGMGVLNPHKYGISSFKHGPDDFTIYYKHNWQPPNDVVRPHSCD